MGRQEIDAFPSENEVRSNIVSRDCGSGDPTPDPSPSCDDDKSSCCGCDCSGFKK